MMEDVFTSYERASDRTTTRTIGSAGTPPARPVTGRTHRAAPATVAAPLYRNHLLLALDADAAAGLGPYLHRVILQAGQVLTSPGERLKRVWFPETCVISLIVQMESGSSAEVAAIGREGAVGYEVTIGRHTSAVQAVVQVAGEAMAVTPDNLIACMNRSPSLQSEMWHNIAAIHGQIAQSAACHALHPARARLARFLLTIQDRTDRSSVNLTQECLAGMLGVQRTTVTAAALALMDQGIILYRRGRIDIRNRAGLEAAACECYGAVRDAAARRPPSAGESRL